MLSTSFEFRNKIANSSNTLFKATLTLADETEVELVGDDVMMGTASFSDAVSSNGSFDVGAAIINQFEIELNNYDGRFDEYDFTDSVIKPYIGVELDAIDEETGEHEIEWLFKGVFGVEQPESYGCTIGLTALDNMRKFEKPYSEVSTSFANGASLQDIVDDICTECGVTLKTQAFANRDYVVAKRPDDTSLTCLQMLSYVAQLSGNYARCDVNGELEIKWYNTAAFEDEDWLDGERFDEDTPYSSGDTADGGSFSDYTDGYTADGGGFTGNTWAHIFAMSDFTVSTDDVVVTGIRVTASDQVLSDGTKGNDGETSLSGSEGYVLDISGNPLIEYGKASAVAALVYARVGGMRFRPFDVSAIGNPAIEAGDSVIITDRKQNQYTSYLTSLTYRVGRYEAFACHAETPSRNRAASFSALTKAVVAARNAAKSEKTARELAQAVLAQQLAGASGMYQTDEAQSDGSVIRYLHDKPTLAQSDTIWKITANAFGVSTDGGATYSYGVNSNGVAILNRIYAVGIDADYITTGSLTVRDPNNTSNILFKADVRLGVVNIAGFNVSGTSLYNDSLKLDDTSLTFRYNGSDVSSLWAGRLVDANDNVLGQLQMRVPYAFQIISRVPYQGSSSDKTLLNYSRDNDTVIVYNTISKIRLNTDLEFGGSYYYKIKNAVIQECKLFENSRVMANYIKTHSKEALGDSNHGMLLTAHALEFGSSYITQGSSTLGPGKRGAYRGQNYIRIVAGYGSGNSETRLLLGNADASTSTDLVFATLDDSKLLFYNVSGYVMAEHSYNDVCFYKGNYANPNASDYTMALERIGLQFVDDEHSYPNSHYLKIRRLSTSSTDYGLCINSLGPIALSSPEIWVRDSAVPYSNTVVPTYSTGQSGTLNVVTGREFDGSTWAWTTETITFVNGIMVTQL